MLSLNGMLSFTGKSVFRTLPQTAQLLKHAPVLHCCGCLRNTAQTLTFPNVQSQRYKQKWAVSNNWNPNNLWHQNKIDWLKWKTNMYPSQFTKETLLKAQLNLYVCATDFVDFGHLIRELRLSDNFLSWYLLMQLHVWMLTVKLSQLGPDGYVVYTHVWETMWGDVEKRLRLIKMPIKERKIYLRGLYTSLVECYLYMDEGLIGSDRQMAGGLWMTVFKEDKESVDFSRLALLVDYVRKNVQHHDKLDSSAILKTGYISFLPLYGDKLDKQKAEADFQKLMKYFGTDFKGKKKGEKI